MWYNILYDEKRGRRMKIERYGDTGMAANCYLLTDDRETAAVIVDPSVSYRELLAARGRPLPPLTAVLLTHAHYDHMIAIEEWRGLAPLALHRADAPALGNPVLNVYRMFGVQENGTSPAERLLEEGDVITVGAETLTVLHTPGHTPGSVCYRAKDLLLSGDTLFAGTIGRTDLPGGQEDAMRHSLGRLFALDGQIALYPGHGPQTTVEREKKYNPYVQWSK